MFGVLLAEICQQSALAIGIGLVYGFVIEGLVFGLFGRNSSLQTIEKAFPGANATALTDAFGQATRFRGTISTPLVGVTQAIVVLAAFTLAFFWCRPSSSPGATWSDLAVTGARILPRWILVVLAVVVIIGLLAFQLLRPLPVVAASISAPAASTVPGAAPALPLPAKGEASVGTAELGLLGISAEEQALPMASTAKLMTALVILDDKPLAIDTPGPAIAVDAADVADYQTRQAVGESTVAVVAGEQLSEFDALQGLLIPSANNFGALLASGTRDPPMPSSRR